MPGCLCIRAFRKAARGPRGAGNILPGREVARSDGGLRQGGCRKRRMPGWIFQSGIRKAAAAYSPTWCSSTIGASELNFSVRNGKRWILTAITAAVFYLREIFQLLLSCLQKRSRAISTGRLKPLLALHLLPINVVVSHDP